MTSRSNRGLDAFLYLGFALLLVLLYGAAYEIGSHVPCSWYKHSSQIPARCLKEFVK